jgi:hypothetical protein
VQCVLASLRCQVATVKEPELVHSKCPWFGHVGRSVLIRLRAGGLENWNLISCGSRYFPTRLRFQTTVGPTRLPLASGCVTFWRLH